MRITESYQRETIAAIRALGTPLNELPDGYIAELYARWSDEKYCASWMMWGSGSDFIPWALKEM